MTYLLDTNVVSEIQRRRPDQRVANWMENTDPATLHISVMTLGEIAKGVARLAKRDSTQAAVFQKWLDATRRQFVDRVIPVDSEIAEIWGRLNAKRPLPVIDGLLAATALVRKMIFVTRDTRDIADTGVRTINPWLG
jgi:predicted nucleic acid-binding protein